MAVIHVLDKHTAELIAAGEVVERPASVVKELLENAIDAGASQITVTIESGGVKLIEISDNGSGIEAEYIPTAFIRHATSKIRTEDDLNHIHTLGFRGEALASIASVARVEVLTRTENDECASVYRIEGGEDYPLEPGARGVGTTIRVQDLFYNTPARMKFLKKDSSEGTFVADIVAHVALSHPEVSFKFVREGKLQYVTPGDGKLRSAAYAVLGREFSRDLMELDNQEGVYRVPVHLPSHLIWLSHGGDGPLFCQLLVIPQLPQGLHVVLDVAVQLRPNGLPLLLRHTAQGRKHPVRIIPPVHIMPGPAPDRPGAPHSPRRSRSARRQPPPAAPPPVGTAF